MTWVIYDLCAGLTIVISESSLAQQLASRLKLVDGKQENGEDNNEKNDNEVIEDTAVIRSAYVDKSLEILKEVSDALLHAIQSDG